MVADERPIIDTSLTSPILMRPTPVGGSRVPLVIWDHTTRIEAISRCASVHIPHAQQNTRSWVEGVNQQLRMEMEKLPETARDNFRVHVDDQLAREIGEAMLAPHYNIIAQSLLIFAFSCFDAFLANLLRTLYAEQPLLVKALEDKTAKLSEIRECESISSAVNIIVQEDISSLLRESYETVFKKLAARFGMETLRKVDVWGDFIECSQRRHLVTHCDGIVSDQYLINCREAGVRLEKEVVRGAKLDVSLEYLQRALEVLYQIGVKLAHTVWRKTVPDKIWVSEKLLAEHVYTLCRREQWTRAQAIGSFAMSLPGYPVEDLQAKMTRINYAQALKWGGHDGEAREVLNIDWSGSIRDFRLGVDVLRGDYENAGRLMRDIGKTGELVSRAGYCDWPLFREFRETPQFHAAFHEIYGQPFKVPIVPRIVLTALPPPPPEKPKEREMNDGNPIIPDDDSPTK